MGEAVRENESWIGRLSRTDYKLEGELLETSSIALITATSRAEQDDGWGSRSGVQDKVEARQDE